MRNGLRKLLRRRRKLLLISQTISLSMANHLTLFCDVNGLFLFIYVRFPVLLCGCLLLFLKLIVTEIFRVHRSLSKIQPCVNAEIVFTAMVVITSTIIVYIKIPMNLNDLTGNILRWHQGTFQALPLLSRIHLSTSSPSQQTASSAKSAMGSTNFGSNSVPKRVSTYVVSTKFPSSPTKSPSFIPTCRTSIPNVQAACMDLKRNSTAR